MIIAKLRLAILASVVVALGGISDARGQLIGSTVNVSPYYPDSSSVYFDAGDRIVSAAIEYPAGSYPGYNPSWQVNITDNQLIITDATSSGLSFGTASFNGFVLDVISGPYILSATTDPSSTIVPVSVTIDGSNRVLANFSGVDHDSGGSAIINLIAIPEPATLAILGFALGIIAAARRQR